MLTLARDARPDAPDAAPPAAPGAAPNAGAAAEADERWAQTWFLLARHEWASLALVPAAPDVPVRAIAERLAACAHAYGEGPIHVLDAAEATPAAAAEAAAELAARAAAGQRFLVALPSPVQRAAAIPLARAADAALLVVPLGEARVADARQAVAAVGQAHFLGSVTLPAPGEG